MTNEFTYVSRDEVFRLSANIDIEARVKAILALAHEGKAGQHVRTEMVPEQLSSVFGIMPAYQADEHPVFSAKVVCVVPGNPKRGLPAHQGFAMLFDAEYGKPLLLADAGAVTEVRTAALTVLATRTLAGREGPSLVVGSSHQAEAHVRALHTLGQPIHLWARNDATARELVARVTEDGIQVTLETDLESAVRNAAVITLVTGSPEPLLRGEWVAAGTHINAIGSSTPRVRELGADLMRSAEVFVDDVAAVTKLSGEVVHLDEPIPNLTPLAAVYTDPDWKRAEGAVTVFKSVGVPLQDLAMMEALEEAARAASVGQAVTL